MKLGAICHNKTINRTGFVIDRDGDVFLVVWHSNPNHGVAYHWYDINALPLWNDQAIKIDEWMENKSPRLIKTGGWRCFTNREDAETR